MSNCPTQDRQELLKKRFAIEYIRKPLLERFLRYVQIHTTSSEDAPPDQKPSTEIQLDLARILYKELQELGISSDNISLDEHGFVLAKIPATPGYENCPSILFNSHMDTSCACSGKDVKPQIHENYDGQPINVGNGVVIDPKVMPSIKTAIGDTVITSDGSTLLGADDKCGVSEIMTFVDVILNHEKFDHGPIEIMFNCDEEIGHGTMYFPESKVASKIAFTVDGDFEGNLEYENFNAYSVVVDFKGIPCHPGSARGKMVNAIEMAASYVSLIPKQETPETTDLRQGFYCPVLIKGELETAQVSFILRDFDMQEMQRRIEACKTFAKAVEAMYPGGVVTVHEKLSYLNMYDKLKEHPDIIETVKTAFINANVIPKETLIRGGTDGCQMTSNFGIMTPNLYTGSDGFHSKFEWAALGQMISMVQVLLEIAKLYAQRK